MKKFIYLTIISISSICFISCEKDTHILTTTHECASCSTEVCSQNDSTSNVCATCGMKNCTMGCATN